MSDIWESEQVSQLRAAWRDEVAEALRIAGIGREDPVGFSGSGLERQLLRAQGRVEALKYALELAGAPLTREDVNIAMFAPLPDPDEREARFAG